MDKREVDYLKKVFAAFGCKDADIQEVDAPDDLLCSFAVNTEGTPIETPDYESFFSVGDYPRFCVLSKKGAVLQLDFCMELTFVIDYVVGLYLKDDFDELGVYFISDEDEVPYCVEFGAIIHHIVGNEVCAVIVENFGTVSSGEISGRAVFNADSNLPFKKYVNKDLEDGLVRIDEFHLNNVIDLRLVNAEHETYADAYRFATTIDQLDVSMVILGNRGYSFKVIVNTRELCVEDAQDVEEEFEHSKNYWRNIYEEGLK